MDIVSAWNYSIEQFAEMWNVTESVAQFVVPAILVGGSALYMSSGNIADFIVSLLV